VRWTEIIRYLMGRGETSFIEAGGEEGVLTRMVARIRQEATPLIVEEPRPVQAPMIPLRAIRSPSEARNSASGQEIPGASALGSESFKADYNLQYAYYAGSMYKGIASKELVVRMGRAGFMGFLGTGGMGMSEIEECIHYIQRELRNGESYGLNLLSNPALPHEEEEAVDLFLRHGIRNVEASAYIQLSPALVRFRLSGLEPGPGDTVVRKNRIIAKVSRPEVAMAFLEPAPGRIVDKLVTEARVTRTQAELSRRVPVADDICVEADSGGHTDGAVAYALLPTMIRLRDEIVAANRYDQPVHVGAAGGIGTPEAALAAFMLDADFIVTGSINQCTVEAGTSDAVKDMLQGINVQDTDYAPAGDLFELGAKVQVLKKGVFFPARANKLYEIYRHHDSLEDVDEKTRRQIQDKYFKRSFDEVWAETRAYYQRKHPAELERAERSPKHKMALIFKWYFVHTSRLAMQGVIDSRVDFQVHCGPALGAFNQWVKGTPLENWRNRHVDVIAHRLMEATAETMAARFQRYGAVWTHIPQRRLDGSHRGAG
jgi:trans-AT polyketide synthase/acyltransferase/oxidoreductase domain-containing protein